MHEKNCFKAGEAAQVLLDAVPEVKLKKSAIEVSINYVSYFMGSMALDARA